MSSSGSSGASRPYRKPYVDSSVFIGWIQGEIIDGVDREDIASHILRQAERGIFRIAISAWTLAEVHKPRGQRNALTEQEGNRILRFFQRSFFDLVDVDREVGEEAHELCRLHGIRPADAVHVACALRAECDVLLTWDSQLIRIQNPPLPIDLPRKLGQAEFPPLPTSI